MKAIFKKNWIHLLAILIFLIVAIIRFYPQIQGKTVSQSDVTGAIAMQQEAIEYNKTHDDITYWTNSMFGGMPTYAIWAPAYNGMGVIIKAMQAGFKGPIGVFFTAMICFYFLLILFGVSHWIAILGSITFSLGVNHILLWDTGHTNKFMTVANSSLILGALYLGYEKRKIWSSSLLMAFGLALNIYAGHVQMTYYLFLSLLILTFCYLIVDLKNKNVLGFLKISGGMVIGVAVAMMMCFSNLSMQYIFKKDTMRGAPILEKLSNDGVQSSSEVQGLSWDYAMQWSNGPLDVLALIVPLSAGGGSAESLDPKSELAISLMRRGVNTSNMKLPFYFGSLPFTAGAIYFGIIVFAMFLFSCFRLTGPIRWWLVSSTALLLLLSMGKHMQWFNQPFFNWIPLYNSFRAPSSITSVALLPVVFGAILGVKSLTASKDKESQRHFIISIGILAVLCSVIAFVLPSTIDFAGGSDAQLANSGFDMGLFNSARGEMMRNDGLRSLLFLGLLSLMYFLFNKNKIKSTLLGISIVSLMIIDIVPIGYRYLDNSSWVNTKRSSALFTPRPVDTQILGLEKSRGDYRVLDLSVSTFQSSIPSYYHNTIGGYNAAKLQRFDDLIDRHLSKNNINVLNMLNTKYIITRDQTLQVNNQAFGNAWFVDDILRVDSPLEEIDALNTQNLSNTAIILDNEFDNYSASFDPIINENNTIELVNYSAKQLEYSYTALSEQFAVFSEIWFGPNKGWKCYLDGKLTDHVRVNYVLRGMRVPQGNHSIKFVFEPDFIRTGITVSKIGTALLYLNVIFYMIFLYKKKKAGEGKKA